MEWTTALHAPEEVYKHINFRTKHNKQEIISLKISINISTTTVTVYKIS